MGRVRKAVSPTLKAYTAGAKAPSSTSITPKVEVSPALVHSGLIGLRMGLSGLGFWGLNWGFMILALALRTFEGQGPESPPKRFAHSWDA